MLIHHMPSDLAQCVIPYTRRIGLYQIIFIVRSFLWELWIGVGSSKNWSSGFLDVQFRIFFGLSTGNILRLFEGRVLSIVHFFPLVSCTLLCPLLGWLFECRIDADVHRRWRWNIMVAEWVQQWIVRVVHLIRSLIIMLLVWLNCRWWSRRRLSSFLMDLMMSLIPKDFIYGVKVDSQGVKVFWKAD